MRHLSHLGWIAVVTLLAHCSPVTAGQCRIQQYPAIAVTMQGLQPTVWAQINGIKGRFLIDTGAFWSMLSQQAQDEYKLPYLEDSMGMTVGGINGLTHADVVTADTFTFLNVQFRDVQFLVGGNDDSSGTVGLLGGNVLRLADVEYDFADGLMRFVKAQHCDDVPLAYWAVNQPIGEVDLRSESALDPELIGHASVNGTDIRVEFDTGSSQSVLTLEAAKRAAISPDSPGVRPTSMIFGIGRNWSKTWIAPVALFEIGGEKIEHTHVLISDVHPGPRIDMLLGADFFLSHHVYVANSQHKLYFTYNGGPVFDLGRQYWIKRAGAAPVLVGPGAAPASNPAGAGPATPGASQGAAAKMSTAPMAAGQGQIPDSSAGADGLMRQGVAYASEGQYVPALADLSRACQLDPKNAECLFRRGKVYWADRQPDRALEDFNTAIRLQPDLYRAHLARASLLLAWSQAPADAASQAKADVNIAELLAPNDSELRLGLAGLYARMGDYAAAIREFDRWVYYHDDDALLPDAWNERCWVRAEANMDLDKALKDCDRALDRQPESADFLDSRGLVYLRLGQLERSIADYDAALKINSKIASSLYGRGLAELREGKGPLGRSDLAAAARLDQGIAERFARMGLTP